MASDLFCVRRLVCMPAAGRVLLLALHGAHAMGAISRAFNILPGLCASGKRLPTLSRHCRGRSVLGPARKHGAGVPAGCPEDDRTRETDGVERWCAGSSDSAVALAR
ncbi:hypothetical protein C8Q80DRAFT_1196910 [Daedaleopsis nitida]|nr:hypothetical protein C8Q80DRAFT_1196910 [Daedaleopsis nitida]